MSHHFDTDATRNDSRLNILDMYLFKGSVPDTTAMILTTNPDAGIFAPLTLHPEGLYAFRFDLNGDDREDVAFKILFSEPSRPSDGDGDVQAFTVLRATGDEIAGTGGDVLVEGTVGQEAEGPGGVRAFVGRAAELWAADAFGFFTVVNGLFKEGRYATEAFDHQANLFKGRNNMATVLEVPNSLIGAPAVRAWSTVSLAGHAPETLVYRWGLPLLTHLFLSDPSTPDLPDLYRSTEPAHDAQVFGDAVHHFVTTMSGLAGAVEDPEEYARQVTERIVPCVLPYELGTEAEFTPGRFNGRPLDCDAFDVMLTLGAGTPVADGASPDVNRIRSVFPYCGIPYSDSEQQGMRPLRELIGLSY